MSFPKVSLDDKYRLESGRAFLSGTQALVRLPLMQRRADLAAGLNTAGYISGYRGSPLGTYDQQLWQAADFLREAHIVFAPGVNEDLAATAIWGTQQANLLGDGRYSGVFAIWYGKGPGVDRSGDAIKHGNRMGTSPHGGVLVVFGDDHAGKSSTIAHQSEQALAAAGVPVLYPASVQEYLDLGLHGFALSRYAGVWVGFKCVNETAETTATVELKANSVRLPNGASPEVDVGARLAFDPMGDDVRLVRVKLPRVQAYARVNGLDRQVLKPETRRLGLVAAGKSYLDVEQALTLLGLDRDAAAALGIGLYKPALIWPLDPEGLREFALGYSEILVIEEKAAFLEPQIAHALFNAEAAGRPRLAGKRDPHGLPLFPSDVLLEPDRIALVLAQRLRAVGSLDSRTAAQAADIEARLAAAVAAGATALQVVRTPYFCSGCPHNTSTQVPEGSIAFAGIGCHTMAIHMDRATLPPTQMGGEGMTWAGIAPFTKRTHAFQNLGDGTYFHSGLLAIRAAVNAGVNITYKILVNDAVAMTGGQPVEGGLSVAEITRQLAAERVRRIAIVAEEPERYADRGSLAPGTTVHGRDALVQLQREFRELRGVTAIVYEQGCAAEKRRRRKRGKLVDPPRRAFINERVCEGCGDCSVKSNCVSVEPIETDLGRKRRIDQSSCNKDFSCVKGFCPSFVLVHQAERDRPNRHPGRAGEGGALDATAFEGLPEPAPAVIKGSYDVLIVGIGGTGVVTIGAVLGMAAHLEGRGATVFDMTGLAQKGGTVLSHLRILEVAERPTTPRIGSGEAELVLACDLVGGAANEALATIARGFTRVVINSHLVPTAQFQRNPDMDFRAVELRMRIEQAAGTDRTFSINAAHVAQVLLGDTIGANLLMVGYALQRGLLPLSVGAIEQALRLNAVGVELNLHALALGRMLAVAPERVTALLDAALPPQASDAARGPDPGADSIDALIERRSALLTAYQDARYAAVYRGLVARVRAAEEARVPTAAHALTAAVARGYAKLLAYKDEYEVARLYSDGVFRRALEAELGPSRRLSLLLAPPLLARRDPLTGEPRKIEFGGWIFCLLRPLARLKFLRGRWYDPFGHTRERRAERGLIREYETLVAELVAGLTPTNHALAVEIASTPERIRGYGHVKHRHIREEATRRVKLLAAWRATPSPPLDAAARSLA